MVDLHTEYLGFTLKSPVIIGSSGLTNSIANIKKLAENGAGAIVLKSLFEEQIRHEADSLMNNRNSEFMQPMLNAFDELMERRSYDYAEALDYLSNFAKERTIDEYLKFIGEAKKAVDIPIIASVNCIYAYDWHYFARRIEEAGADALELNIYVLPSDLQRTGFDNEKIYTDIIASVQKYTKIPISLKVGYYFSGLSNKMVEFSKSGIKGLVLFNRPYMPDIDLETMEISASRIYSTETEYAHTLRWIAILAGRTDCNIVAATGVHDHESALKMIVAGADAVQIVSTLYRHGIDQTQVIIKGMEDWMIKHDYKSIADFKGKLSQAKITNPAVYERVQFMKMYSQII